MAAEDEEKRPLLVNESSENYGGKLIDEDKNLALAQIVIKPPPIACPCSFVLEPALFIYAVVGSMIGDLGRQYTYKKVAEDMGPQYANLSTNNGGQTSGCNNSNVNDTDYVMRQQVQEQVSQFLLYSALASLLPSIVMFMFWGAYSDSFGRKLLMLLPPIGTAMEAMFFIVTMKFHLSQYVLFLCPMMEAVIGAQELLSVGAIAFVSDTAPPAAKAFRIALLDVALTAGSGTGEFILGYLIEVTGFFWPFIVIIGGKVYVFLHILLLVPETKPVTNKTEKNICKYFISTIKVYFKSGLDGRRWKLFLLAFIYFVPKLTYNTSIVVLFQLNAPLCWGSFMIGVNRGVFVFAFTFGILLGSKLFTRCLPETWVTFIGLISGCFEFVFNAFVRNTAMMFIVPLLGMFHLLPSPMIRTLMLNLVEPAEQGAMLGGLLLIDKLSWLLNNVILNPIYQATVSTWAGFTFLLTGGLFVLASMALMLYIWLNRNKQLKVEING